MAWQDYADRHVNTPVLLVEIAFNSGTRYYSFNYIRTSTQQYVGKVLSMPQIKSSIGDIKRTYERNKISLEMDDSNYEFRGLEESETVGFKNIVVTIKQAFQDDNYATPLTIYVGQIYDWDRLDGLKFLFHIEEQSTNLENEYPWKRVEVTDYANAHESAIGWVIPVPYGTISALGLNAKGGYGHPSLGLNSGLPFVDDTVDAEKHVVGVQTAAITVSRVYKNGALQTSGGGNDYQIQTQVIDGFTHTEIHWEAGNRPVETDLISCDITFGSRTPVEAIRHFMENFAGTAAGDFNAASYAAAIVIEANRGYTFDGALWEAKTLRTILDEWRDELELDIYWNKAGERCWHYLSSQSLGSANVYKDYLHILEGFTSDPRLGELMNHLKYGYNFNYSRAYFHNYDISEDTDSQTKHGGTFKAFKGFNWIRQSSMASDMARRKVVRFKNPVIFDVERFPLRTYSDNLSDIIKITHFLGGGSAGYVERIFQIRETNHITDNFINEMLLEDTEDFFGVSCILGDDTALPATWALADEDEREYCYLCDSATEEFSDGEPGKRLFD